MFVSKVMKYTVDICRKKLFYYKEKVVHKNLLLETRYKKISSNKVDLLLYLTMLQNAKPKQTHKN